MKYYLADVEDGEGIIIRRETRKNRYIRLTLDEIANLDLSNPLITYHEMIENKPQKFYIDIDGIKADEYQILDRILDHVYCWFSNIYEVNLTVSDMIVLVNKYQDETSFHVIINNYALVNASETKWFYHKVISLMSDELSSFIDPLYKSNQSFRIEGSSKQNKHVYNRRAPSYLYRGDIIYQSQALDYRSSLVSYTNHCIHLPRMSPESTYTGQVPISCADDMDLLCWYFDSYEMDISSYRLNRVNNTIRLDRIKPSYCALCERVHESDNALFSVTEEYIEYKCWRNEEPHQILRTQKREAPQNTFSSKLNRIIPD